VVDEIFGWLKTIREDTSLRERLVKTCRRLLKRAHYYWLPCRGVSDAAAV